MKTIFYAAILFLFIPDLRAGQVINLCEGSGSHCMTIEMDGMRLTLVKNKNKPEISIK